VVQFRDAERLLHETAPVDIDIDIDKAARRALDNRAAVRVAAPTISAEVEEILTEGPDAARRRIQHSHLAGQLDDHQAVNVAVMSLPGGWGTSVFDEQGTGKTLTVVAAFDALVEQGEADVLIVVAPKSMISEWAEEFRRFTGNLYRVSVVHGTMAQRARAIDSGADVVVLNYESAISLATNLRLLATRSKAVLAVDESFFVKNPNAVRSAAVAELREWCVRCFVLCGTPAPNAPHDLVAQFDLVDFGFTFADVSLHPDRQIAAGQVRAAIKRPGAYLRSLKRVVLPNLPARVFTELRVDLAPQQRTAYEAALHDLIADLRASSDGEFARRITSYLDRRNALLRICSDPRPVVPGYDELPAKILALDDLLADQVGERREKVVLWSFYRASLDRLFARYAHFGIARLDGSVVNVDSRRDAIRRFQEDEDTMIFLGNPAAAGAGLTLHRARLAIYESFSNQAAHFLQSLDRIHRRGQDRDVEYIALLCNGTIEESEYGSLLDKADRQADLLGDHPEPRPSREMLLDELLDSWGQLQD